MDALTYHEIVSLDDALYDPWLDLYQTAFPPREQVQVSTLNRLLRRREEHADSHLLAVQDGAGRVIGMSWHEVYRECAAATLWYLAVVPEARGQGVGAQIYAELRRRAASACPSLEALLFEVEDPQNAHSPAERALAERRIGFYRRQGARLLEGIHYIQSVGWQPPVPMRLMAHPYREVTGEDVFAAAKCVFGEALQRVAAPELR